MDASYCQIVGSSNDAVGGANNRYALLMPALERVHGRPTWLLSRANARAQALLGEALASEGVRGYHYRLLAALEQYGPTCQADLGRHTGIDRSDVVAALNDLVADGFARRDPDPDDRRRNAVTITKRGARALVRLDTVIDGIQNAVLAPLTPTERTRFLRALTKLT